MIHVKNPISALNDPVPGREDIRDDGMLQEDLCAPASLLFFYVNTIPLLECLSGVSVEAR